MQPKYQQLSERILRRIESGEWTTGDRLPSEVILAKEYGVAYMTVRSSISALVQSGRLRRIRGRGTFVAQPPEADVTPMLGLLLPPRWHSIDPFYFPPIVTGFTERAEELGYRVHLGDRSEPLLEFIQLRELKVSAVACVMVNDADMLEAESLLDRGVLVVAINYYRGSRRITSVSPDNRGGMVTATNALIKLGHRRFTFLAGPEDNLDAQQRLMGVRQAVREAGFSARALTVVPGMFDEESGYVRMQALLRKGKLPTALITASDLSAIGAMKALAEAGVRIPEEISVMGFGDFRTAAFVHPSLSTARLPLDGLGIRACDLLIDELVGKRAGAVTLDCPLITRESIARPL